MSSLFDEKGDKDDCKPLCSFTFARWSQYPSQKDTRPRSISLNLTMFELFANQLGLRFYELPFFSHDRVLFGKTARVPLTQPVHRLVLTG